MNRKMLVILAVVTSLVLAAAVVAYVRRAAPTSGEATQTLLLPLLADQINDVAAIVVTGAAESFRVERDGSTWRLVDKGGYPVEFETVKQALVGLSELEIVETKTSRPELYARLGVNAPTDPGATSTLIELEGADAGPLAAVILGNTTSDRSPQAPARRYVRRGGEAQSFLVKGELRVDPVPMSWIKKNIGGIGRARVKSVEITHPDGERVFVHRESADNNVFTVDGVPEGRELTHQGAGGQVSGALAFVQLEDVRPAAELALEGVPATESVFRLFNGVMITTRTRTIDGTIWLTAEAAPDPEAPRSDDGADETTTTAPGSAEEPEAEDEIRELNELWGGWVYAINAAQGANFTKRIADLTKAIASEPPPAADGPPKAGYVFPEPRTPPNTESGADGSN